MIYRWTRPYGSRWRNGMRRLLIFGRSSGQVGAGSAVSLALSPSASAAAGFLNAR